MDFLTSKRFVTTALVLLVLLNVTLLSVLWWHNTHQPEPPNRQFNRPLSFGESLSLSKSQTVSFRTLRQEHLLKVQPEMESIALLKKQLVEESVKEKPDTKKIEAIAGEIGAHQAAIEHDLALHFHELAKICTPEQRDSLKQVLNRITSHKHARRMDQSREHHP